MTLIIWVPLSVCLVYEFDCVGVFADVRDRGSVCEVAGVGVSDVLLIETVVVTWSDWVTYSVRVSGTLRVRDPRGLEEVGTEERVFDGDVCDINPSNEEVSVASTALALCVDVAVDNSVELIETPMESVPGMADKVRDGGGDGVPMLVAVSVWLLEGRDDNVSVGGSVSVTRSVMVTEGNSVGVVVGVGQAFRACCAIRGAQLKVGPAWSGQLNPPAVLRHTRKVGAVEFSMLGTSTIGNCFRRIVLSMRLTDPVPSNVLDVEAINTDAFPDM